MSTKKTTKKSVKPIWNAETDNQLRKLKILANKSNSLFIMGITMDGTGDGADGMMFTKNVDPMIIAESMVRQLPLEAIKMALVKVAIQGQLHVEHTPDCPLYNGPKKSAKKPVKKAKK